MTIHAASVSRGAVNLPQVAGGGHKVSEGAGTGEGSGKAKIGNLDLSDLAIEEDKLLTPEEQKSKNKTNREALSLALMNGGCSKDFTLARAEAYAESQEIGQEFDGLVLDELREMYGKEGVGGPGATNPTDPTEPTTPAGGNAGCGCSGKVSDPGAYLYGKDGKPSADEVQQYAVGDCYFFASAMALADADPSAIQRLIKPNDDGSYTVTLYETKGDTGEPVLDKNGKPKTVEINVSKDEVDLATNLGGARSGGPASGGAHWAQVLEVAIAKYWSPRDLGRGLQAVEGGLTQNAFANLTGQTATVVPLKGAKPCDIEALLEGAKKDGTPLTLHAFPEGDIDPTTGAIIPSDKAPQDGLVDAHAYQVVSYEKDDKGETWVTLRNPGGKDAPTGPDGKPLPVDGKGPDDNPGDGLVRVKLSDLIKNDNNELVIGTLPDDLAPSTTTAAPGTSDEEPGPGGRTSSASNRTGVPAYKPAAWGELVPARIAELFSNYRAA